MIYHTKFKHFNTQTLEATTALFAARPYRGTNAEKLTKFKDWLVAVSNAYHIPTPTLTMSTADECGSGYYNPRNADIHLPKFSVVTLLHEFRHHMQALELAPGGEDDARAWSLSLFHTIKPRLFAKSVREGKIFFVHPEDLENVLH